MSYSFSLKDVEIVIRASENPEVVVKGVAKKVTAVIAEPPRKQNYRVKFQLHALHQDVDIFGDPWVRSIDIEAYNEEDATQLLYEKYPELHQSRIEVKSVIKQKLFGNLVWAC